MSLGDWLCLIILDLEVSLIVAMTVNWLLCRFRLSVRKRSNDQSLPRKKAGPR